jgi:hypothetical protein
VFALARTVTCPVTVQERHHRVPDYTLAPGAEIRMRTALVRGPLSLEVTWETR